MLGQMMKKNLSIGSLIDHAASYHSDTPIESVETTGGMVHRTWGQTQVQSRKLGSALAKMGLKQGDRCATIAWNNYRHLEIYFGVSSSGLVCHTINPRLSPELLIYVINHAEDQVLFVDKTFLPIVTNLREHLKTVKTYVLMGARDEESAKIPGLQFYDELIETGDTDFEWPDLHEDTASSLCYTSGTTGNPRGVLYSHRSTVLHSFVVCLPDSLNLSATDTLLPVVPMFHVNAWGIPYAAALAGSRMIMPGPGLDGDSLVGLIDREKVTIALGVPTIWHGLLASAKALGSKLETLNSTVVGGATCPPSMIDTFKNEYNTDTVHAWGMTETSPLGTANRLLQKHLELPAEEQSQIRKSQGRPPFGIKLKITDEDDKQLSEDGQTQGGLSVQGHWVVDSYFREDEGAALNNGWFHTGDIATVDCNGFMSIRDRSKDIIKSGGEWISSVELEGIAVGHPALKDAAVIGAKHSKWGERPVLIAVKAEGQEPDPKQLLAYFEDKVSKWQIPDEVVFVEELPRNATGKILKRILREKYENILLEG